MLEELVWWFETARFRVELRITEQISYQYDGDDESGETQTALDAGELIAFDSRVVVMLDDREVGFDSLGGSVYTADNIKDFWRAHRTSSIDGRNTLAMKERRVVICHYFPDMVRQAINNARKLLCDMPRIRCAA